MAKSDTIPLNSTYVRKFLIKCKFGSLGFLDYSVRGARNGKPGVEFELSNYKTF